MNDSDESRSFHKTFSLWDVYFQWVTNCDSRSCELSACRSLQRKFSDQSTRGSSAVPSMWVLPQTYCCHFAVPGPIATSHPLINISAISTFGGTGPQMQAEGHVPYWLHKFFSSLAHLSKFRRDFVIRIWLETPRLVARICDFMTFHLSHFGLGKAAVAWLIHTQATDEILDSPAWLQAGRTRWSVNRLAWLVLFECNSSTSWLASALWSWVT